MNAIKAKLQAFRASGVGQFVQKIQDDRFTNLGALLAWGTLSAMLPLILGILALIGLVLHDPQRLDQVYNALLGIIPSGAGAVVRPALESIRGQATTGAGIIGLVLLLYNGAGFFSNMASVFNQAYHVEDRNIIVSTIIAILMLIIVTILLVVSTTAVGFGAAVSNLPLGLSIGPLLGKVVPGIISFLSALVAFLLIYKILPNKSQSWRNSLPGAVLATILLGVISLVFPIYLSFFPPNQAYAIFGIFLVFTFWLYLLGLVFVLGAELNAFLEQPHRSVALAEAMSKAQQGKAQVSQQQGHAKAEATGAAPPGAGQQQPAQGGPLGPSRGRQPAPPQARPEPAGSAAGSSGGLVGTLVGAIGLIVAALLIRNQTEPRQHARS